MNNFRSEIRIVKYPNGEIQRVQSVTLPDWTSLEFEQPLPNPKALDQVCELYEKFILPKAPYLFGTLVFFSLPDDMEMPFPFESRYGSLADRETAAAIGLRKYLKGDKFVPDDEKGKRFVEDLKQRGRLRILKGTRPFHSKIMCVSSKLGLLSSIAESRAFLSNTGFFTMDMFDLGSPYDIIGRPIGLRVKNGICLDPPLFEREALLVRKDGSVSIGKPSLSGMYLEISGKTFRPGKNAKLFERPGKRYADSKGLNLAITENRIIAAARNRKIVIPSAGFVLQVNNDEDIKAGEEVKYKGFEDVLFGIQAGNSIIRNGVPANGFISYFSNIRDPFQLPIPPSLYPLDYEKDRAPRMALGADKENRPVIVWAEGPGKFDDLSKSTEGTFSCGASLREMEAICRDLGLINAVNMDGGGSAQIMLSGKRELLISDRHIEDNRGYERPVPLGIGINNL